MFGYQFLKTWIFSTVLAAAPGPAPVQSDVPPVDGPAVVQAESTTPTLEVATPSEVTSGTMRMLRALEGFNKNVKTVHAVFNQVRVDEVFMEKVESQGELWYRKPYDFRCDYTDAHPTVTLITKEAFYLYTPDIKQVDFWKFESEEKREQQMHQLLLGFGFETDELLKIYSIHSSEDEEKPLAELKEAGFSPSDKTLFSFKPRPEFAETSPFIELKLYVDKASHLPEKIWYQDPNNANMTLTMKKIETDVTLDDTLFDRGKLFPSGVNIIDRRATQ